MNMNNLQLSFERFNTLANVLRGLRGIGESTISIDLTLWELEDIAELLYEKISSVNSQSKTEWIPVSNGSPKTEQYVLITVHNQTKMCWYQNGVFVDGEQNVYTKENEELVAWMPLPAPYELQENNITVSGSKEYEQEPCEDTDFHLWEKDDMEEMKKTADDLFDKEQADRDIEAFRAAIKALESEVSNADSN